MENSLILLCNTPSALFAVLASQRSPNHASHAKVCLVELSLFQQLIDDGFLLDTTSSLLNEAWVFFHGFKVKVSTQTVRGAKD
jgi:hypothetical protein